ncbi:hypothetical protein [uncultured Desulfuromonas sp.]|nr:hypothetical protein [uncultured Desulfuromonas sp.]
MIQLPPGFDFRQFITELAELGAYVVGSYAIIACGDVILGILRRGKDV